MSKTGQKKRRVFPRPSLPVLFVLAVIVVIGAVALSYTNVGDDVAFVQHFLTPPAHFTYHGHTDWVYDVAWSPDGKRIASTSKDKTVQIWDAADGKELVHFDAHVHSVVAISFSPDGKILATGGGGPGGSTRLWDFDQLLR